MAAQLTAQLYSGLALGSAVPQGGEDRAADQLLLAGAAHGVKISSQAVAVSDRARLVQDHSVHVAAGFHRLTGHGDDIEAGDTVHAGDTDGGQQAADGSRDQADQQGNQSGDGDLNIVVHRKGIHGDHHDQEDDGQGHQKGVQSDLVGGFLPGGTLYQSDHAVQKAVARLRGDADLQPVRHNGGAAGDGAEVAAALPDHGGGLAGDGGLIHRGDALNDLAVVGNDLAGADQDHIALLQLAGGDDGLSAILVEQVCLGILLGLFQRGRLCLAPAFSHGLREVGKQNSDK